MPYRPRLRVAKLTSIVALESAMRRRNINGSQLARVAGISRQTVSHLRTGRTTGTYAKTAEKIADALNVPVEKLFEIAADVADVDDEAPAAAS